MYQDLQPTPTEWSFGKKLAFRFFFLFFPLYIFFNPNGVIPLSELVFDFYIEPFHQLIPWIAKHVLNMSPDITVFTNGSGDTTYDYVVVLFIIFLSLVGAMIWAALDRKRTNHIQLYYWLTAVVRYYAAFTMLTYGLVKVIKLQFPFPDPWRLLEPYGDSSPMGLAWTFMGYSEGYNYFTGGAEVLGGVLLFFRRTTTLGAMVTFAVMGNVMAMNYCFDIPVKLLSTMLVIMAVFLMAKDLQRLYYFFFANKAAPPSNLSAPYLNSKALRISLRIFKVLLIVYGVGNLLVGSIDSMSQYGDRAQIAPLWGIYNVETFIRNNDTVPPLQTDSTRWKQMIVGGYKGYPRTHIKGMNDSLQPYVMRTDTIKKQFVIFPRRDSTFKNTLAYHYPDKEHLVVQGTWEKDSIYVRMKIYDVNKFLLVNRGFRWVNEYPFNR
jgi:hypothetical protein